MQVEWIRKGLSMYKLITSLIWEVRETRNEEGEELRCFLFWAVEQIWVFRRRMKCKLDQAKFINMDMSIQN